MPQPLSDAPGFDEPDDALEQRHLSVPPALHGERLDRALAALLPEFSRNWLAQLIAQGAVQLDGAPALKPARRVQAGWPLCVELRPTPASRAFTPQAMPLDVLHEDAHILVINKPAGLVVHPAPGNWSGTLLNGLLARDARAFELPRAGIVHRLDKDTSGLMVVARSRQAQDALAAAIAAREVRREYLALAHRPWSGGAQGVDAPIGRDAHMRLRMAVTQSGRSAQTHFEPLATNAHGCLLRCLLRTGRTHQIRVHLAHLGHPIVADALYGGAQAAGMARQALHARRLSFVHPTSGEHMHFEAPPPADFTAALAAWGMDVDGV